MIPFRFIPIERREAPYPDAQTGDERVLNVVFGPTMCTECDLEPAEFCIVWGEVWDGSSVCGGEGPCASAAISHYGESGFEPWDERPEQ